MADKWLNLLSEFTYTQLGKPWYSKARVKLQWTGFVTVVSRCTEAIHYGSLYMCILGYATFTVHVSATEPTNVSKHLQNNIYYRSKKSNRKKKKEICDEKRYKKRGTALWNQAEVCPNGSAWVCSDAEETQGQPRMQCFSDEHAALWACTWANAISYFSSPLLPSLSSSTHQRWGCLLYWAPEGLSLPHGPPAINKQTNKQTNLYYSDQTTTPSSVLILSINVKCHFVNYLFSISAALCWVAMTNVKLVVVQNPHKCIWNIKYFQYYNLF